MLIVALVVFVSLVGGIVVDCHDDVFVVVIVDDPLFSGCSCCLLLLLLLFLLPDALKSLLRNR